MPSYTDRSEFVAHCDLLFTRRREWRCFDEPHHAIAFAGVASDIADVALDFETQEAEHFVGAGFHAIFTVGFFLLLPLIISPTVGGSGWLSGWFRIRSSGPF